MKAKLESFIKREQEKESQREKKQAEKKQKAHLSNANANSTITTANKHNGNQHSPNVDAINKSLSEFNLNSMSSSVISHKRYWLSIKKFKKQDNPKLIFNKNKDLNRTM